MGRTRSGSCRASGRGGTQVSRPCGHARGGQPPPARHPPAPLRRSTPAAAHDRAARRGPGAGAVRPGRTPGRRRDDPCSGGGDRGLELRFELRRVYLKLMGDPKNYRLRDNIAATAEIAAEAEALGDTVTQGEALLRTGRLLGDIGQTYEGRRTSLGPKSASTRPASSPPSWRSSRPSPSHGRDRTVPDDIERAERALSAADESSPIAAFSLIGLAVDRALIGDIDEARSDIRRGPRSSASSA